MRSIQAPIQNPWTTSQTKLSKQNLETLQDQLRSHSQPDSVSEWISLTSTTVSTALTGSKKSKATSTFRSAVAESGGHKYTISYTNLLYRIGILPPSGVGIIPPVAENTEEVRKYFPEPNDLPSLARYLTNRFREFQPNEASWVVLLCQYIFLPKVSLSVKDDFIKLQEFPGPFKSHNLRELMKSDWGIKYPIVKHDPLQEESQIHQTPAGEDLRSRSDFVFAASIDCLGEKIRKIVHRADGTIPCASNSSRTCAVAISGEVKATASSTSHAAAKNQWSSLAYLQIMERVSIRREASYVGDEDICQYGYCICGLEVTIWKMGIKWNRSQNRKSEILPTYFTFPVQDVGQFDLGTPKDLEDFVATHQKLLHWWLNGYLSSYLKDIKKIIDAHPGSPELWKITWQEAAGNHNPDSGGKPEIELIDASALEEQQPAGPSVGAENEGETQGVTTPGEQPVRSPVGAANEGEALEQDDTEGNCDGVCCGTTRNNTRCRKRVKIGKYCLLHRKEY